MSKSGENIHKRRDGRWEGRYIKGRTPDRKPVWGYLYGSSYAEVHQLLIQKKAESGFYQLSGRRVRFEELAAQWLHFYQLSGRRVRFEELAAQWLHSIAQGIKESTLAHYSYTLKRYLLPVFGTAELHTLDEQRLEQGLLQVIAPADDSHKALGAASARECLTMLRRICKYAAHLRLMRPVEIVVKLPQAKEHAAQPLSAQEQDSVQVFILRAPTPRKLGLLLQMQMGLRIGEVCGLQWGDFDLEKGTLSICRTVSRIYCPNGRTKVVVQAPKTKTSRRELPIPCRLLSLLRRLRGAFSPSAWFLSGRAGKPVEPRCYRKSIQGYLRRAGVRRVHPHALRHTFATTCLQSGCDIKTLSEILGHADANVTLKRYVHTDMKRKKTEMQRVFSAVWKKRPAQTLMPA